MEESSKQYYKSIFGLVKSLDEQKKSVTSVHQLLSNNFEHDRRQLIDLCERLMLCDFESLGRKAREVLWRKAYYEPITQCRKIFNGGKSNGADDLELVQKFLDNGVAQLKRLVVVFERKFGLELKDIVDLNILDDADVEEDLINEHFTMMEVSYAWDIVHATLISIGDLYRYYLGFEFAKDAGVTQSTAAGFYEEAFKMNATVGMAQNQLGTLFTGKNYSIDSTFHYLFALNCKTPFELSEGNVSKIFQQNAIYLESPAATGNGLNADPDVKIRNFVARFILLVDKDIDELCDLCRSFLVDIKLFLDYGDDGGFLSEEMLFKMVAILLFCLNKLTQIGSKKAHSLNALLVALTSDLVDCANRNYEQLLSCKEAQNLIFSQRYNRAFERFEVFAREYRQQQRHSEEKPALIVTSHEPDEPLQMLQNDTESEGRNSSNKENDEAHSGELKKRSASKGRQRQRRRRRQQNSSDDEDESDADEDDCLSGERFHFDSDSNVESDTESNLSFESYEDSDDESDAGTLSEVEENQDDVEHHNGVPSPNDSPKKEPRPEDDLGLVTAFDQLSGIRFRRAYKKVDPNILIEFSAREKTFKALHLLFDWLSLNTDVLVGCYSSNPEFIHKIMRLVNNLNIDIYTRKVYFDRSFITIPNLRVDLRYLFDVRQTIPTTEDVQLKRFTLLTGVQQNLDWELDSRLQITSNETKFLRMYRLIDFGFHLSKLRKFHYFFCAKSRVFIERPVKQQNDQRREERREKRREDRRRDRRNNSQGRRGDRRDRNRPTNRGREEKRENRRERRRKQRQEQLQMAENGINNGHTNGSDGGNKKRYLKNKFDVNDEEKNSLQLINGMKDINLRAQNGKNQQQPLAIKRPIGTPPLKLQEPLMNGKTTSEKMGELWLRNEVKNLENKMGKKATTVVLTPYIVVDTKALVDFTSIIKNLVRSKKFVILVPNAVLGELDDLKKISDGARNAIKWLEQEFTKGNRFLRSQRAHEILPLTLVKMPKKLDRESITFVHIVQFCNYIVTSNIDGDTNTDHMITLLTGDNLIDHSIEGFSCCGILNAIPVKYEQIINFYSKYKNKK